MTDSDDNPFQALLGIAGSEIKKVHHDKSPDFYQAKPTVSPEKRHFAEHFEHAPISQANYNIGSEDEMYYRATGIQKQVVKRLEHGEFTVEESIDLHGMTTMEAEIYMATTIDNLRLPFMSCIRVVHGKGYNVKNREGERDAPVLKNFTARYLSEHPRVLAYCSCPVERGGTGAVYVLIKRYDEK